MTTAALSPIERFRNLTSTQQASILDAHRHINTDYYDWWDCTENDFKDDMGAIGVDVDKIYFSLGYCQSDYAACVGRIKDWPLFLKSMGYTCPALAQLATEFWGCRIDTHHRGGLSVSADLPYPPSEDDYLMDDLCPYESEIQRAVWYALISKHNLGGIEKEVIDTLNNHAADLYHRLRDEDEGLTSDEAVLEALDANDMLEDELFEMEDDD